MREASGDHHLETERRSANEGSQTKEATTHVVKLWTMLKLACVTLLVEGALSLLPAPRAVPQHRRVALRAGDSEWEAEVKQASGAFLEEESKNWLKQMSSGIDSEMRTANNALIDWLSDNGVWVSDQSGWDQPPHALALSSATVDEAEGEASGRGLLMRRAIAEAQPLFTLPFKLCMLKTTAREILGEVRSGGAARGARRRARSERARARPRSDAREHTNPTVPPRSSARARALPRSPGPPPLRAPRASRTRRRACPTV